MKIFLVFFGIIWFDLNVNAQNTYVPDNNFEQALIVLGYDSGFLNDSVPTANISGLTSLNVNNKNIADLTGIEGFTGLTSLKCSSNQLKTLDVSNNTALILLHCFFNQITTLDVSKNTALTELICYTNQLTNLDVSNNTALTELFCFSNKLTLLDVSKNTALTELFCSSNQLTHLYINNGENAKMANVEAYDNPNLFCIQVDNPALAANYTNWFKDSWATYNVICAPDSVYVPDDNFEQALIDLGYDSGALNNWVPTANISGLTTIDLNKKNIADLTGIEGFTSLTSLYCNSNKLTTLDVSKNTALTELVCSYNQLTMLDISKNTALIELWINANQLTTLDVSKNTALTVLWSHSNQLTTLD
jgi:Leucine-rich repeat (LRR) protein